MPGELQIGEVLADKYEITGKIGEGGMGAVYKARHLGLGRMVAIKTLLPELVKSSDMLSRFQQEARAASSIGNPHIVNVFDLGRTDSGAMFQVMELLEGESLDALIQRSAPLDIPFTINIGVQILGALNAAHKRSIVHRDLKPENIFLCSTDDELPFVKLLDFGVSKVLRPLEFTAPGQTSIVTKTQVGSVVGTPLYMAPEQAGGVPDIDPRADLWAIGVVLYQMLTGTTPFNGATYHAVLYALLDGTVPPPSTLRSDIPPGLESVLMKALAKNRDNRYSDALTMRTALKALATPSLGRGPEEPTEPAEPRSERATAALHAESEVDAEAYAGLLAGNLVALDGSHDEPEAMAPPVPEVQAAPAQEFAPPPQLEEELELAFDPRTPEPEPQPDPEPSDAPVLVVIAGVALIGAILLLLALDIL
mgnify:CR=1 FL=1